MLSAQNPDVPKVPRGLTRQRQIRQNYFVYSGYELGRTEGPIVAPECCFFHIVHFFEQARRSAKLPNQDVPQTQHRLNMAPRGAVQPLHGNVPNIGQTKGLDMPKMTQHVRNIGPG